MSKKMVYAFPNLVTPNNPVEFNEEKCNGCNTCIGNCSSDVLFPNPQRGKPPFVIYPDECWYCGCCVKVCPRREEGAIRMSWPMVLKVRWKRKDTGEHFRLGMPNPPAPNPTPPVGGWDAKA